MSVDSLQQIVHTDIEFDYESAAIHSFLSFIYC